MMPDVRPYERLGQRVKHALGSPESEVRTQRQRQVFEAAFRGAAAVAPALRRRRVRLLAAGVGAAVLLLAALAAIGLRLHSGTREVAPGVRPFTVETGPGTRAGRPGERLEAATDRPAVLEFGGGRFVLAPRSGLTVLESTSARVRGRLHAGRVTVNVIPGGRRRFEVLAGGYRVEVVGTRFTLAWDPARGRLAVEVSRGTVRVSGEGLDPGGLSLGTGRSLAIEHRAGRLSVIRDPSPASAADPAGSFPPLPRPDDPLRSNDAAVGSPPRPSSLAGLPPGARTASPVPVPADRWSELFDARKYGEIVADAVAKDLPKQIDTLPLQRLWLLANAGRYAGRGDLAVQALAALRRRFPGEDRARRAAFLLGRVYLDMLRRPAESCTWFGTYGSESPDGPLAEEALGRLADACWKAGQRAAAVRAARAYVQRFPNGVFRVVVDAVLQASR